MSKFYEKLLGFFKKDLGVKLISVLLAVLFWFFVINADNPFETRDITIPIRVIHEDSLSDRNIVLKDTNYRRSVKLVLRGRSETLKSVKIDDFDVVLDFDKVKTAQDNVVELDGPLLSIKGITEATIIPRNVELSLEKITGKSFPVAVELIGKPKVSYVVTSVKVVPASIELTDMESIVSSISSIQTSVDITNLDKSIELEKECKAIDLEGKTIPKTAKKIIVRISIEVGREVLLTPVITGTPGINFVEIARRTVPDKITVIGPSDVLAKLTELKTEKVDLANAEINVETPVALVLPKGVKLADGMPETVQVEVDIEKLVTSELIVSNFNIDILNMLPVDQYSYEVVEVSFPINLKGREKDLAIISASSIKPSVNAKDMAAGLHSITVNFSLPSGVKLMNEYKVLLKITKLVAPTPTPIPTPTPTPTPSETVSTGGTTGGTGNGG